jgi:hypothetical protein
MNTVPACDECGRKAPEIRPGGGLPAGWKTLGLDLVRSVPIGLCPDCVKTWSGPKVVRPSTPEELKPKHGNKTKK